MGEIESEGGRLEGRDMGDREVGKSEGWREREGEGRGT